MSSKKPYYSFHALLGSIKGTATSQTVSSSSTIPRGPSGAPGITVKKEPVSQTISSGIRIKAEPKEINISDRFATGPAPTVANVASASNGYRATGTPQTQNANTPNTVNRSANGQSTLPFHKAEDARPAQKLVYTIYRSENDIAYTPEGALNEGHAMANAVKNQLAKLHVGNKMRQEVWRKEITRMENTRIQDTMIALCGATGAGKSSVINAILGDNIVPTSGMRACTATVTEIRYHDKRNIEAYIEFLSLEEWKTELEVLIGDLQDENGDIRRLSDMRNDAGVAWHKVHAVYPHLTAEQIVRMSADAIIASDSKTARALNTTKRLSCPNSKEFGKQTARYIDSKNQKRDKKKDEKDKKKMKEAEGPAYWPLIRQVKVYVKADALSTGAVLCDLPGCADANAARSNIAKDYMKRANCIWVLAPIHRAVDDKTAKDLLGDAFKTQLLMDGNYDDTTVTFVATKADDIAATEIIDALHLEDEPDLLDIEATLDRAAQENKGSKLQKERLANDIEMMKKEKQRHQALLRELEEHLHCVKMGKGFTPRLTAKAKRSKAENPKKRKSLGQGRKGKTKKRKYVSEDEDDEESAESQSQSESEASADQSDDDVDSDVQSSDGESEDDDDDEIVTESMDSSDDDSSPKSKRGKSKASKKVKKGENRSHRPPTSDEDSDFDDDDEDDEDKSDDSSEESDVPKRKGKGNSKGKKTSKGKSNGKGKDKNKHRKSKAGSDNDSDAESADEGSDEEETEETLSAQIASKKEEIKTLTSRLREAKEAKTEALSRISESKKTLSSSQKKKNAFCALKRAEYSRDVLKQDFRLGLRELDETVAIERDAASFDPSVPLRDYGAIDLPVFCVSARDYARIHRMNKGDGDPSTFTDDDDTEIPELRVWCKTLTENSRERNARIFLESISVFATSILSYVEGLEGISPADREALRQKWQTPPDSLSDDLDPYAWINRDWSDDEDDSVMAKSPPRDSEGNPIGIFTRLRTQLDIVIENTVEYLKEQFKSGLKDKCAEGAANAASAALDISDEFTQSMHWQTYRATLRREGAFRADLNELLCMPLTKNIAGSWTRIFETNMFSSVEGRALQSIQRLLNEMEESTRNSGLKERCRMQGERALEEAKVDLAKLVSVVGQLLQSRQKDISRCIAPTVREGLRDGYLNAALERGTGSVARQKALFRRSLDDVRNEIFEGGTDNIFALLENASESIGKQMEDSLEALAQKVEVNLAVLWDETNDSPEQKLARADTKIKMREIIGQVAHWRKADTLRS